MDLSSLTPFNSRNSPNSVLFPILLPENLSLLRIANIWWEFSQNFVILLSSQHYQLIFVQTAREKDKNLITLKQLEKHTKWSYKPR